MRSFTLFLLVVAGTLFSTGCDIMNRDPLGVRRRLDEHVVLLNNFSCLCETCGAPLGGQNDVVKHRGSRAHKLAVLALQSRKRKMAEVQTDDLGLQSAQPSDAVDQLSDGPNGAPDTSTQGLDNPGSPIPSSQNEVRAWGGSAIAAIGGGLGATPAIPEGVSQSPPPSAQLDLAATYGNPEGIEVPGMVRVPSLGATINRPAEELFARLAQCTGHLPADQDSAEESVRLFHDEVPASDGPRPADLIPDRLVRCDFLGLCVASAASSSTSRFRCMGRTYGRELCT